MNLKLDDLKILMVLESLRNARRYSINYYEAHKNEEDRIGVTSPEEWEELYNTIIKQLHEQGEFEVLTPIDPKWKISYKA